MRPMLTKEINYKDFMHYYWLESELKYFCTEIGINDDGNKTEIENRIKNFLRQKAS